MSFHDPMSELVTKIKNATRARHESVQIPYSGLKASVLRVMAKEGFISGVEAVGEGARKALVVQLKYTADRLPLISEIRQVSKPGMKVFATIREIRPLKQGAGMAILSTSRGVLKDMDAKRTGVGGEVLCTMW